MLQSLIEVLENGVVRVRTVVVNGETSVFAHHAIAPGDSYSGEEARVQAVCKAVHTADVIAAYKSSVA